MKGRNSALISVALIRISIGAFIGLATFELAHSNEKGQPEKKLECLSDQTASNANLKSQAGKAFSSKP